MNMTRVRGSMRHGPLVERRRLAKPRHREPTGIADKAAHHNRSRQGVLLPIAGHTQIPRLARASERRDVQCETATTRNNLWNDDFNDTLYHK